MKFVDLSGSSRMDHLMDLTRQLRGCRTAYDALLMYCNYLDAAYANRAHLVLSTRDCRQGEYRVWRLRTDDGIEHLPLADPWKGLELPIHRGGPIATIIEKQIPHLVGEIDWAGDPNFSQTLKQYHSLLAVPLFNEGLPLNWSIFLSRDSKPFDQLDLEASVNRATLVGSLLGSLHVSHELAEANAHIDAELERMARIQHALLPDPIPDIPGLHIAANYQTFIQVGGDIYDFVPLDDETNRWCFFIGDASGHGPSAAVSAAMVQAILHACAADAKGPADLVKTLNKHLCQKRIEGSFVTAFVGFYEPSTRGLTYCCAGHPPPMLPRSADRPTTFLDAAGGLPLGIDTDAAFEEAQTNLNPGDLLLIYTDGISEARCPQGKMFGTSGIEQSLDRGAHDADRAIEQLSHELLAHQLGQKPLDDQTAIAIHVRRFA
jgi:serine phosphatase RsbU (regulator of sigma subunit)